MSDHNHTATIWSNVPPSGAHRRQGPGTQYAIIDMIPPGTPVVVFCYSHGSSESWTAPNGHTYTSDAWDFVVTRDPDLGGFVADVLVDTGGDITQQLGEQNTCRNLKNRLPG